MNREARQLDQLIRDWWLQGPDEDRLAAILDLAVSGKCMSIVPLGRALFILDSSELPGSLAARVDELRNALRHLATRTFQLDVIGDIDNEPETLFSVLGEEVRNTALFDADKLRKARLSNQGSKASTAKAFVETLGWSAFEETAEIELKHALTDLTERERFEAWGLFVGADRREGIALGINFTISVSGTEVVANVSDEVVQQARIVAGHFMKDTGCRIDIEWPAQFAGESVGLPLAVAALTAQGDIPKDALLGSTGRLDVSGNVLGVSAISEKIQAARQLGLRRVLVPKDNFDEAVEAAGEDLTILRVQHVAELRSLLRRSLSAVAFDLAALTRLVRASTRDYGLTIVDEKQHPHGRCFIVGSTAGRAQLWVYSNGNVLAQGKPGKTLDDANRLVRERVPPEPEPRPSRTFDTLTRDYQEAAQRSLESIGGAMEVGSPNESWRIRIKRGRSSATVVSYNNGKCILQGNAPAWQAAFEVLNATLAQIGGLDAGESERVVAASPYVLDPDAPHIGTDEAGKGDYFGPLVSAAVYVDKDTAATLRLLGVRDSKTLKDKRVIELASKIKQVSEGQYVVTPIFPPKYNDLYSQFQSEKKNLNALLAWGHAKSIDKLLAAPVGRGVKAEYILVDQFADTHHVEDRSRRVAIPIYQRPKAEDDIAVAAASILAREAFLTWLDKWSKRTSITLPKGASEQVVQAGKIVFRKWGNVGLSDVAKMSFRTTAKVLEGENQNAEFDRRPWATEPDAAR